MNTWLADGATGIALVIAPALLALYSKPLDFARPISSIKFSLFAVIVPGTYDGEASLNSNFLNASVWPTIKLISGEP